MPILIMSVANVCSLFGNVTECLQSLRLAFIAETFDLRQILTLST